MYPFGAPAMLPYTFVNVSPPSWLSCRLPSSVPIQITPGFEGDSRICVASELDEYPSCFATIGLSPARFMIGISAPQRFTCFVRSVVFIVQVSPRLFDLKKYCAAI